MQPAYAWGYCSRTLGLKPPRAHYCSVSKALVLNLDHYCIWCVLFIVGLLLAPNSPSAFDANEIDDRKKRCWLRRVLFYQDELKSFRRTLSISYDEPCCFIVCLKPTCLGLQTQSVRENRFKFALLFLLSTNADHLPRQARDKDKKTPESTHKLTCLRRLVKLPLLLALAVLFLLRYRLCCQLHAAHLPRATA
jgi:hypothetical protein